MKSDKAIPPVIKWTGSKRTIAPILGNLFPLAGRFIDPFVGGGALLPFRTAKKAIAGDVVAELITLWCLIQTEPSKVADGYEERWSELQKGGYTVYYEIRDRFNALRNPIDFLFLSRTCVNGLIRFNKDGHFNNSLHHTRPGISPNTLRRIIAYWSQVVTDVEFRAVDYRELLREVRIDDLVFLDPPYTGTRGRYMPQSFNIGEFYQELGRLNAVGAKWVLTLDGQAGNRNYESGIPETLYKTQLFLETGKSPFPRLMRTSVDQVQELVYLNFKVSTKCLAGSGDSRSHPFQLPLTPEMHSD